MSQHDRTRDDILDPPAKGLTGPAPKPEPRSAPVPAPAPDLKTILDHIAEVSKNARASWFGLLGLLVFVGVTLLGHKDADFFADGSETQLPLIGITVPVKAFFYAAPVLVAALYAYLHLYLMALWDGLADAPQIKGMPPLADQVHPTLLTYSALWYRNRRLDDGCAAPHPLGLVVVAVSLALGSLFGIAVLALLWLRSMPAHDEGLTLWIALCFSVAFMVGQTSILTARARMAGATRESVARAHWGRRLMGGGLAVLLALLSWETTEGSGIFKYPVTKANGSIEWWLPLYPADLREAALIARPDDWQPYDRWLEGFREAHREENGIDLAAKLTPTQRRAFWAEARTEWDARLAMLPGPELRGRDLRQADTVDAVLTRADLRGVRLDGAILTNAELQGAELACWDPSLTDFGDEICSSLWGVDLSGARMQGADLSGARMQGANLSGAQMQGVVLNCWTAPKASGNGICSDLSGADLSGARMQGANLSGAEMQGVVLSGARMQGVVLSGARMQGANLSGARMQGVVLSGAQMQGADLSGAEMQGANLTWAGMQGANLFRVEMQGADLFGAQMQGANLSGVEMQGADLFGAQMQGADLSGAEMQGANLSGARMQGVVLSGAQMQNANCSSASLRGALLQFANVTCRNLKQEQLAYAVGDFRTVLPHGLTVASCLKVLPDDVEEALAHHPEEEEPFVRLSRAQIRDALLCDVGAKPHATGSWPFERRF